MTRLWVRESLPEGGEWLEGKGTRSHCYETEP